MSKSTVNDITFGCVDFIVAKVGDVPSQQVSEFIFGKLQGAVRGNVAIQIHDMHRHAPELVVHEDANGIRELPDAWTPDSLSILSFDRQELPGADELILGGLVLNCVGNVDRGKTRQQYEGNAGCEFPVQRSLCRRLKCQGVTGSRIASYTSFLLCNRAVLAALPRFWIMPTMTRSCTGLIPNHVPPIPYHQNSPFART